MSGVARFICRVLEGADRYEPCLISLAMSSTDDVSQRILNPRSWLGGVRVRKGTWEGRPYVHVGARLSELEFMRYTPRRALTELLGEADLVQVVAGTPCWALPATTVDVPVCVHVATLAATERSRRHRVETGIGGTWRRAMTQVTRRLDLRAMRSADRVFAMNSLLWQKAITVCGPGRVILAPPGVDVHRFRPRDGTDGPAEKDYILSVARFADPRKNVELLFRAYASLRRRTPSAPPLWLAGSSGPSESAWRIALENGVGDAIRYLGPVSDQELARLYRNALFFALSSDEEGFGLVVVEAMASGIPAVSTDCGGPGDIITDGEDGLLAPVEDAEALAGAMKRLVENPELRRRMGRRARRTAVERYSFRVAGQRFLEEYDALLGDGGSQAGREQGARGFPFEAGRHA